jgi:hypothetical protein
VDNEVFLKGIDRLTKREDATTERWLALFERLEKLMSTVSDALAAAVAANSQLVQTNATLAASVVQLAQGEGTPDSVLQPILDTQTANNTLLAQTNDTLQAALPPAPPPPAQ